MTLRGIEWGLHPRLSVEDLSAYERIAEVQPIPAQLLANRGIQPEEAVDFLMAHRLPLEDPGTLPQVDAAVERILQARERDETVIILGDYDSDGLTSQSIIYLALRSWGIRHPLVYTPHRSWEGFGLHMHNLAGFSSQGATLLIALDCGTANGEEIAAAKGMGIDTIVIDHHPSDDIPGDATSLVNPNAPRGQGSPFSVCSAAGLCYLFCLAGEDRLGMFSPAVDSMLIGLAAIGTIADVAPLTGQNRIIASRGLRELRTSRHPGIISLSSLAGVAIDEIDAGDIGFQIGPRINAAGRVGKPEVARSVLLPRSIPEARMSARQLDTMNNLRKKETAIASSRAVAMVEGEYGKKIPPLIVVAHESWDPGIIGLVASHLVGRYHRPTLVFAAGKETSTASGRSIAAFDMGQFLANHHRYFTRHGGHPMAAGCSLATADLARAKEYLVAAASKILSERDLARTSMAEMILDEGDVTPEIAVQVASVGPFGNGNPEPIFRISTGPARMVKVMGRDRSHLSFSVNHAGEEVRCVWWGMAEHAGSIEKAKRLVLYGTLTFNSFRGSDHLQIVIQDAIAR